MRWRELFCITLRATVSVRRSCSLLFQASAFDIFPGPPFRGGSSACWGGSGLRSGFCGAARFRAPSPRDELTGASRCAAERAARDAGSRAPLCGEASDAPRESVVRRELCGHARRSFPPSASGRRLAGRRRWWLHEGLRATLSERKTFLRRAGFSHHSAAKNQGEVTANNGAAENCSARHGSCCSRSWPSRAVVALSHVRCRFLRSTFAATAPRSAVSELESLGASSLP